MAIIPVFGMTILQGVTYYFCPAHRHVKLTTLAGAVFAFCYNHGATLFGKRTP